MNLFLVPCEKLMWYRQASGKGDIFYYNEHMATCLKPDVNMCRNWAVLANGGANIVIKLINVFQELKSKPGYIRFPRFQCQKLSG